MKDKVQPEGDSVVTLANGRRLPSNTVGLKQVGEEEDASFPVKIQGAGVEPFELQIHRFWLVQDAVMAVLGKEEVAPRTSLSLSLSGTTLDPLAELQAIKGLKPGATLRLVEDLYTPRTARVHLAHLQEFLRGSSSQDALREGRSPSLLNTLSPVHNPENGAPVHSGRGTRRLLSDSKVEQQTLEAPPPEYILPGSKERPLMPLLPSSTHPEVPNCLIDLSLSIWNPPPGPRKLQGDFLYISICTLEGRWCDITSCPKGYFLNRSSLDVFDPRPASSSPPTHCLSDLLSQISPGFKKAFMALRNRSQPPPIESMPTPYRTLSWLGPPSIVRCHRNSFTCRLGLEEQGGLQAPDWNEEMQTARDLPQGSLEERLHRDRLLLQVNSAFVWAAAQAVEAVIDGCVTPINGGGEEDSAFLCGGLFVSRGGASEGGERGNRVAQRLELQGVQAFCNLEGFLHGLHTLPSAVVDYRGSRLLVQGLAPGLHGVGGDSKGLLYGISAGVPEEPQRRRLLELLAQASKALSIEKHVVLNASGHPVPLFTSAHTQGLLGADGRLYLFNLFHVQPADTNYHVEENQEQDVQEAQEGWPDTYSSLGFPRSFPHKYCLLRAELTQAFIQHKQSQFSQRVRERMEEAGGISECSNTGDAHGTEAVREACKDVGSVSSIIFEMRFNPDVFCPGVQFPSSESSGVQLQKRLLREAAAFLVTKQIPAFLDDCLQFRVSPIDGATLCQAMHQKGINLRYLGQLATAISQSEHREKLRHITRLVYGEIAVRSARRIFSPYLQNVEVSSLSAAVSHFLCCLLVPQFSSLSAGEEPKKRSRRRGRGGGSTSDSTTWSALSGAELWALINQDVKDTYHLMEGLGASTDQLMEQYGLQKFSLLRGLCLKAGIQLRLRDYTLDNCSKAPIGPDDIINIFPVVKHVTMVTSDASQVLSSAQKCIKKGQLNQAHELLKEASYLFGRVCDDLHPEASMCLSTLAQVAYLQGNCTEARRVQMKAVVVSERVLGFDHPGTIQEYARLAVYVFMGHEVALAQRCLYRARLLMLLVHGEDHPYMATLDSSLGLVLQGEQSVRYLQSALRLNTHFRGLDDMNTALNHHLLAQRLCCIGDYRKAMTHEREALAAFQGEFGDNHVQTRCSAEFLKTITQQAVRVERSMRQSGSELMDSGPPPESLIPSKETTLEQLAIVNGILKVSVSDKINEIKEKFRELRASADASDDKHETTNGEVTGNGSADEEATGRRVTVSEEGPARVTDETAQASTATAINPEDVRSTEKTESSNQPTENPEHGEKEEGEANDHRTAETATAGTNEKPAPADVNAESLAITDQSGTAHCNL